MSILKKRISRFVKMLDLINVNSKVEMLKNFLTSFSFTLK
jgi:hypothetical protein